MASPQLPGPLVSPDWLAAHLSETVMLDVTVELPPPRFDGDYRIFGGKAGWRQAHIPGSVHADLIEDLSRPHLLCSFTHPDAKDLLAALERLGIGDGSIVVAYDRADGFWAARLWWIARAVGVDIGVLDGGFAAWNGAGYPIASGSAGEEGPRRERGHLSPRPALPGSWVERIEVEAALAGAGKGTLVCALSADMFDGRGPTRYARRGVIPGSLNLPARDLLGSDGRMKEPDVLDRLFAKRLGETAGKDASLLLYCGGGISASFLALGLVLAGRNDIAIYDNSLQEWSAITNLPLVLAPPPPENSAQN